MTSFTDNFWGDKNNGFNVLYNNMKHGHESSKEFADFLRESYAVEETYAKLLAKLAKYASGCTTRGSGSFSPFWQVLKVLAEKLSNLHLQLVYAWQELMKDVQRYTDEQYKKQKTVKDQEAGTMDTVHCIQQTIGSLQKAKETYHARCIEYEKLKRDNASQKDIEKAEIKFKKANDDYRGLVDKYANVRNDFETKMIESCKRFQELEEHHLSQMKDFVDTYTKAWENQHALIDQVHDEFRNNCADLTVDKLLEAFVQGKTTGTERPGPIEFEDTDLSSLPPPSGTPDQDKREFPVLEKPKKEGGPADNTSQGSPENQTKSLSILDRTLPLRASTGWFLKSRKKEKKKKKKEKDKETESNGSEKGQPKVDEDGFSIRPENASEHQNDRDSWYSSSDSDSDQENRTSKIKVEIKPFSPNGGTPSDNVDDIKKSIEGLRLSPTTSRRTPTNDANMKRSISVSETMNTAVKPSQDLLGLDIFGNSASSSASTPTGGNYSFPSAMNREGLLVSSNSTMTTPATTPTVDDSLGTRSGTPPVAASRYQRCQTPTGLLGGVAPLLPGPPPPTRPGHRPPVAAAHATARPTGRQSPALRERADSVPSLNNVSFNSSASAWSSRGPSPLTIGMADSIPLAVAFSETVHAYFKGSNSQSCRVKLTGDLMMSFPAGVVRLFTENPSPSTLCFHLKNITPLEHILVNKLLISEDVSQATADSTAYSFEMGALVEHLRRESDKNRGASYFNIDILKYQVRARPGAESTPLHLASYWKCDGTQSEFHLDYKYHSGACPAVRPPLANVTVLVPLEADVINMQSVPSGTWSAETKRAVWRLGEVSEQPGGGSLRAKFDMAQGPARPNTVAVQFLSEGTTLSGVDFELTGLGYRLSLVKRRFITGKYISESASEPLPV